MFKRLRNPLRVHLDDDQQHLEVEYHSGSGTPLFDICDEKGRILKSGKFLHDENRINVQDLLNSVYVFLVLDGDRIRSRRFKICR